MDDTTQNQNMQPMEPDTDTDEIAATLGYLTSILELGMTPQEEPTDMQGGEEQEQAPAEEPQEEEVPDPNAEASQKADIDSKQDEEIASIKAELEKLLKEEELENGTETENKDTAGEAE